MGQRTIDKGGGGRGIAPPVTDDRTFTGCQTQPPNSSYHARRRLGIVAGPDHDAGDVEDQELGAFDDLFRQIIIGKLSHEFR